MIFSSVADILFCGKQANFFLLSTFSTAGKKKKNEIMRQIAFQEKQTLCHHYQLSSSNQASHTIFDNPISLE